MTRYFLPLIAAALAFAAIIAAATNADASHRKHHHHKHYRAHASVAVYVPPERVAAFRRSFVDRHIGPSGSWMDRRHYYYRPYHYWRGPLVYKQTHVRRHYAHANPTKFVCRDTKRGTACRER